MDGKLSYEGLQLFNIGHNYTNYRSGSLIWRSILLPTQNIESYKWCLSQWEPNWRESNCSCQLHGVWLFYSLNDYGWDAGWYLGALNEEGLFPLLNCKFLYFSWNRIWPQLSVSNSLLRIVWLQQYWLLVIAGWGDHFNCMNNLLVP